MSIGKVNHPVWHAIVAQSLSEDGAAESADQAASEWWDTNGWTDKVITAVSSKEAGSAGLSLAIDMWVSPKGYYELRNEATVDTEDYEVVSLNATHSAVIMTRYDSSDVDDLQRPIRSMKIVVDNNTASSLTSSVDIWVEGWS